MVKILFSFIGSAIYYTAYVPIWVAWNLAGKYVWRAFMVVFVEADQEDSKDRALSTFIEDARLYIAYQYIKELRAGG